ncbi:hypothetical protein SSS_08263 [Sarcoptes scabiei]|nr:hypothetical protein SSS_08263 [Sarcoptes scabiei]
MISNESDQSNQFNENFCQTEEIQIAADGQRSSKHSQTDHNSIERSFRWDRPIDSATNLSEVYVSDETFLPLYKLRDYSFMILIIIKIMVVRKIFLHKMIGSFKLL